MTKQEILEKIYELDKKAIKEKIYKHTMIPFYSRMRNQRREDLLVILDHYESLFICGACMGTGVRDENNVCGSCNGIGKKSK